MILQVNHQLTLQEFLNFPTGEGDITYELVDGQAIPKMSPKKLESLPRDRICNLNKVLQQLINPAAKEKAELVRGDK